MQAMSVQFMDWPSAKGTGTSSPSHRPTMVKCWDLECIKVIRHYHGQFRLVCGTSGALALAFSCAALCWCRKSCVLPLSAPVTHARAGVCCVSCDCCVCCVRALCPWAVPCTGWQSIQRSMSSWPRDVTHRSASGTCARSLKSIALPATQTSPSASWRAAQTRKSFQAPYSTIRLWDLTAGKTLASDLGVSRACQCVVWVAYIDLVPLTAGDRLASKQPFVASKT